MYVLFAKPNLAVPVLSWKISIKGCRCWRPLHRRGFRLLSLLRGGLYTQNTYVPKRAACFIKAL